MKQLLRKVSGESVYMSTRLCVNAPLYLQLVCAHPFKRCKWSVCLCVWVCSHASKKSTFSHTASITPLDFSALRDGARGAFFSFALLARLCSVLFCPQLDFDWVPESRGDVCCPLLPSKRPGSLFKGFPRVLRCWTRFCKAWMVQKETECGFVG